MGEFDVSFLVHIAIFLIFPFIGGYLSRRLGLTSMVGYIISGILMGTFLEGVISKQFLTQASAIGVVLLLFTVGLELNVNTLRRFGNFVIKGGLAQIIISGLLIFLFALALHPFALLLLFQGLHKAERFLLQ